MKRYRMIAIGILAVILMTALVSGCGRKPTPAPTISAEQIQKWAAETVNAIVEKDGTEKTQIAVVPQATPTRPPVTVPTLPEVARATAIPTVAPYTGGGGGGSPAQPVQPRACDSFNFVADVTVPDKTAMTPGQAFTKIWRIVNNGTCTWNQSYSFVFVSGDQMSAPAMVQVPTIVAPGGTVDIAVDMRAPNINGEITSNWMMRNASGAVFGTNASSNPIWAKIVVSGASGGNVPGATAVPANPGATCTVLSLSPNGSENFSPNQSLTFSVTVRNDTNVTWDSANYDLAMIDGNNMLRNPAIVAQDIPYNIGPGQNLSVSFDGVAPNTGGTFPMTWGIVQNNVIHCQFTFKVNVR